MGQGSSDGYCVEARRGKPGEGLGQRTAGEYEKGQAAQILGEGLVPGPTLEALAGGNYMGE